MTEPFERWNLTRVVNASGTMTSLGASRVESPTIDAIKGILPSFVIIDELQSRASGVIAAATGAEAGCVTGCSAAAMTLACAAAITGTDLDAIEKLPDCGEARAEIDCCQAWAGGAPMSSAASRPLACVPKSWAGPGISRNRVSRAREIGQRDWLVALYCPRG
jgi:L-seryl-tRNA(Ser) seleniumtransferase